MTIALGVLAALAYALAARQASRAATSSAWAPLALLLHAAALYRLIVHGSSLEFGTLDALSLLGWQAAALQWLFCLRENLHALSPVHYGVAAVLVVLGVLLPIPGNAIPLADWQIGVHIVFSILSAGLLTLAAVNAVALMVLDQMLRSPARLVQAQRLPPLQTMETLLFRQIAVGFFLLSLVILSGLLFVHDLLGQHLVHKTVLTATAWLMFGVLLWGRVRYGWRGRKAIRWTLCGYVTLVTAYFGSKLVLEQLLGTHWS